MVTMNMTRRAILGRAASLASLAAFAGTPLVAGVARAASPAPFPTLPQGRLVPRAPQDYDNAMLSGGPGKDGIPSIDSPQFWNGEQASEFLDDDDIVFGLSRTALPGPIPSAFWSGTRSSTTLSAAPVWR